ncbi:MAG: acyltransferase family protein [Burkholderiaceae bacterium]
MPAHAVGRVSEIDIAKGVGITLVVLGHMVARDARPLGNDWWIVWHERLYSFHMAFFFFLSGYVFFLKPESQWEEQLRKSAAKLAPAYLLFALLVYLGKYAAAGFLHVDRPVKHPLEELLLMVAYPTEGFAQFLWFIVTLLMIMTVATLLRALITRYLGAALIFALVLHILSVTDHVTTFLALHQLARYLVFFLLAALCHRLPEAWASAVSRFGVMYFVMFVAVLIAAPERWLPTLAGLLSVPALVALAHWIDRSTSLRRLFHFLGRNTLTIYLMNSLAMGLVRALVFKIWDWNGWHFFVVAPVLLLAGLVMPILAQRWLFSRWRWTNHITR